MQLFATLLSALVLVISTTASTMADPAAVKRSENIVVMAQITEPVYGEVWKIDSKQLVAWNTSTVPPQAESETASILLGYFDDTGLEHVDYDNPLASDIPLKAGKHTITVPDVAPGSSYFVILFGDSGDLSPTFIITSK